MSPRSRHPASRRGTSNSNARGSAADRRARRRWLVDHFGDGVHAPCHFCWKTLDEHSVSVDRVVPGCQGGRYVRGNIRPACVDCNASDGGKLGCARKREKVAA